MPGTGADSPIWIVTRNIHRDHRKQNSVIESEIIVNPDMAPPPITLPFDLKVEAYPPEAVVDAPKEIKGINAVRGTKFPLEVTPHVGSLMIRLTATATWKDAQGVDQTATQIRYIQIPG